MKTIALIIALLPSMAFAENLFTNSDMNTAGGWKGDKSYKEVDKNKVLALKANPRRVLEFSQNVDTHNLKDVVIKFRYMSADYKGRGLQIKGERSNGSSTFRTSALISNGQWQTMEWAFSEIRDSRSITFSLNLLEGEGTVLFDDITAVAQEVPK